MKKFRKLIPALALLLVSAVLMSTASYAWFSMNNKVTVTGMEVKTQVSNNLLIAPTTTESPTKKGENEFKTSMVATLHDTLLEPVSTIDGKNFYYTSSTNVGGNGDTLADSFILYATTTDALNAFNKNAGTTGAVGYVDYAFELKAQNTSSSSNYIDITKLSLQYAGTDTTEKAFRVAVFVEDLTAAHNNPTPGAGTLKTILTMSGSHTFSYDSANSVPEKAVSGPSALSQYADGTLGVAATIDTVPAQTTKYYKVVVRLWLEGEDTTCNNSTFATLTQTWALDIAIVLQDTTGRATNAPVAVINTGDAITPVALAIGTTVKTTDTIVIDGVTYYEINSVHLAGDVKIYKTTNEEVAAGDTIFMIDGNHPIDVTNRVTIS